MAEPDKKPSLKDFNLDKAGVALSAGLKKGVSFFKKAKAAVEGDEAAKEELSTAASGALVKAQEKAEQAGKALGEIADKVEQKIEQHRKPPTP